MTHKQYNPRMCGNGAGQPTNKKMLAKPGPEAIITPSGGKTYKSSFMTHKLRVIIDFLEIFESEARCCGPTTGPKELFNVNKQECCSPKKKTYFLGPIGKCDSAWDGNEI